MAVNLVNPPRNTSHTHENIFRLLLLDNAAARESVGRLLTYYRRVATLPGMTLVASYLLASESLLVSKALEAGGLRLHGREAHQLRPLSFTFPLPERGRCMARIGETQAFASVSADIVDVPDSASSMTRHGLLEFHVRVDHASGSAANAGGQQAYRHAQDSAQHIARYLERVIKTSKALDTELLCIVAGQKLWSVRVDVALLSDDGNCLDCCAWAVIAALRHYRRPEVTVRSGHVVVFGPEERDPVPLALHHTPITFRCAIFDVTGTTAGHAAGAGGARWLLDPSASEADAASATVDLAIDEVGNLCGLRMNGAGSDIDFASTVRDSMLPTVTAVAAKVHLDLNSALAEDEARRKSTYMKRFEWAKLRLGVAKRERSDEPIAAAAA